MTGRPGRIVVGSFEAAARAATDVAVVIDVFRAFTTAATVLANGAERIVMTGDLDAARRLRADGVGRLCIGERGSVRPEGFDFGNSPVEVAGVDFSGETVIQTTSNGTRGILAASGARITIHLLHELRRRGGKYGLGSACIGGGQGGAVIVEAL